MADQKALVISSGVTKQVPDADTLIAGAGIKAAAGKLLMHGGATVPAGDELDTAGTGNINLPNNASARFKVEGASITATVTAANLDTLTAGPASGADGLHTHSAVTAAQVAEAGLTTAALADGDFGYVSAANTLAKTDADLMASSRCLGANEGTVGSMTVAGVIENAKFTTAGGSPGNGAAVYLAPGTEEAGAAGKLTATAPSTAGQVVAEVGIVLSNANYAGSKTSSVSFQPKAPIQL